MNKLEQKRCIVTPALCDGKLCGARRGSLTIDPKHEATHKVRSDFELITTVHSVGGTAGSV